VKPPCLLLSGLVGLLLWGCHSSEPAAPRERLAEARAAHQRQLGEAGLGEPDSGVPPAAASAPSPGTSRTVEGDTLPGWATELPESCVQSEWCGVGVIEGCETAFSCRATAEIQARRDLLCNVSSRLRTRTVRQVKRTLSESGEESGALELRQETRERCATLEIREPRIEHFYWAPERQHFALVRMPRSPASRLVIPANAGIQTPSGAPASLPVLRFPEATSESHLQQQLRKALSEEGVRWDLPEAWVLEPQVRFRHEPHEGTLFHGRTEATLHLALTSPEGDTRTRSWGIRRFAVTAPQTWSAAEREQQEQRTLEKGLREFREELLSFLQGTL
jgi:hypothetical protein